MSDEKVCDECCQPCEGREVTIDDSFYYEYGDEARTHHKVGIEILSDCCEAEMRDPKGAECWDPETLRKEAFEFLDELRLSGKTNMLGATPYIAGEFELEEEEAKELLVEWMSNFGKGESDQ